MKNDNFDLPLARDIHAHDDKTTPLSKEGQLLIESLKSAKANLKLRKKFLGGKTYNVSNIGSVIGGAYEKIRNSAEYTDGHLLLTRAIRRFLNRNLFIDSRIKDPALAEELVIELTQGGYVPNDTITSVQIDTLNNLISEFYIIYKKILQHGANPSNAKRLALDTLSVECGWIFNDPSYLFAYLHFSQHFMLNLIEADKSRPNNGKYDDTSFIYCLAILKNLLKADRATMQTALMEWHKIPHAAKEIIEFNKHFEKLLASDDFKQANVIVNRNGAPLRVIRSMFFDKSKQDPSIIKNKTALIGSINQNVQSTYDMVNKKLNSGVIKSIIFLIVTKVLIGVAIEIPLDFLLYGSVIVSPLMINLLTPPIYMALQRLTLRTPGERNTIAIQEYICEMLYANENKDKQYLLGRRTTSKGNSRILGIVYTISSIVVFAAVIYLLKTLNFNVVQGVIFFVFFSTATFLGYRLSLIIKDIELVGTHQSVVGFLLDFIYTPFIYLGQWLAGKYSKFNIVSTLLDLVIELPLKTVLRVIRQWTRFMDEKKETIV